MEKNQQNHVETSDHNTEGNKNRRGILFLAAAITVLITAILFVALPQFYVKKITVEGCTMISPDELAAHSGISKGDHLLQNIGGGIVQLFTLRYGNIEEELRNEYPYIGNIIIRVSFPSEVQIVVEERKKIGYVQIPDGYVVIDADGYVVELSSDEAPKDVPLMLGIPVRAAVIGHKIDMTDDTSLNACVTVLGAILSSDANQVDENDYSLMKCVKSIRSVDKGITFLTILLPSTQKELLVRIGSLKNITEQMSWLRYAISLNEFDGDMDAVLDMSGDILTYRPVE